MNLPRTMARFMNNRDGFHPSILNPKPVPVASHGESQVEQLELAKQAGSDYYELSAIESELKKLREIAAARSKNK